MRDTERSLKEAAKNVQFQQDLVLSHFELPLSVWMLKIELQEKEEGTFLKKKKSNKTDQR